MAQVLIFAYVGQLFTVIMFIICFYFVLTFFQYLKQGDDRLVKQSKWFALLSFALGLIVSRVF